MTQKMKIAWLISENESMDIYQVASANGDFCTRGGARVFDLAKEYMIVMRAKWAYEYRHKRWHFREGFRVWCRRWYYKQLYRLVKETAA